MQTRKISHLLPLVPTRHRNQGEPGRDDDSGRELDRLRKRQVKYGTEPIAIDRSNRVISGWRRLEGLKQNLRDEGMTVEQIAEYLVPVIVWDTDAIAEQARQRSEQARDGGQVPDPEDQLIAEMPSVLTRLAFECTRRAFSPEQIVYYARQLRPSLRRLAREAQRHGGRGRKGRGKHPTIGKVDDVIAEIVGLSRQTLLRMDECKAAAEQEERDGIPTSTPDTWNRKAGTYRQIWEDICKTGKVGRHFFRKQQRDIMMAKLRDLPNRLLTLPSDRDQAKAVDVIRCGDCRELLRDYPHAVFDAAVFSPPYCQGVEYEGYTEPDGPEAFWIFFQPILAELRRVVRPGGAILVFQPECYADYFRQWYGPRNQTHRVYHCLRESLNLDKRGCHNQAADYVVIMHNPGAPPMRPRVPRRSLDWFVSKMSFGKRMERIHPCPTPYDICEVLLDTYVAEGGLVLDPFCGLGNVPLAAKWTGRHFVGIDRSEVYCALARRTLESPERPWSELDTLTKALDVAVGRLVHLRQFYIDRASDLDRQIADLVGEDDEPPVLPMTG